MIHEPLIEELARQRHTDDLQAAACWRATRQSPDETVLSRFVMRMSHWSAALRRREARYASSAQAGSSGIVCCGANA